MISFFQAQPEPLIGLDIGADSLHWVELARDGRARLRLERCAAVPLAPGCIVQGQIERFEDVSAALKRLAQDAGSKHRHVALAMPASAVQTQVLTLLGPWRPGALEQQVRQAVALDRDSELAALAMDFGLVHGAGATTTQQVWTATTSQDMLQDRLGLAESAGLIPTVVDGQAQACARTAALLLRMRPATNPAGVTAFVLLLSDGASLQLLAGHKVVYQSAVWPSCPQTVFELCQLLQSEMASVTWGGSRARLELILLTGDTPEEPSWCESLGLQLGCDCQWADPVKSLVHGQQVPSFAPAPLACAGLMTAFGLALRRFKDLC
ncbi:MAG: pilus assembly protein PilM [Polaromonas sp.]|nr:pilus assembly protein PilM [Polaromonas sp.]